MSLYDADGRVTARKEYAAGGALIRSEKHCYDAVGNIEKKLLAPGATCGSPGSDFESYTYDNEYRLATTSPGYSFGYDAVGNMTVAVCPELEALRYEYDADNRLQRVMGYFDGETVYQFTYDENGNRIEKRDGSGALLESYVYDAKNRLVELDAGGQVTHYEYDPYDYRISQETNGEKMLYFLDGENIESIYDGRGKPKATFLRGAVTDEIIAAYHYDDRGQRQFYTYFHDGVTSVTALADHTGAIKQTYTYSPFGQDLASTGSTPNTLKYTGREQDPSGLYYYRARYYDPSVRRFLSEDPLGLAVSFSLRQNSLWDSWVLAMQRLAL